MSSYSEEKLIETVRSNLDCLLRILEWNVQRGILFFRISSNLIPFASHTINQFSWQTFFTNDFQRVGEYIRRHDIRISMHPDQFVVLNSLNPKVVKNSIAELEYHADVLDLLGLEDSAKIQIHVGGVFGDREKSMQRLIEVYKTLDKKIKRRLVIENDDRLYSLQDCLTINREIQIPIIFDTFHHELLNNGESLQEAFDRVEKTWKKSDGKPMIDYSSQEKGERIGKHATTIDLSHFTTFYYSIKGRDVDVMLEIKDKENSALKALEIQEDLSINL